MNENVVKALRVCTSERTICSKICPYHNVQDRRTKLMIDAADTIEELQKLTDAQLYIIKQYQVYLTKQHWISVAERLPKEYDDVSLQFQHNQAVGFWDGECWCVYSGDNFYTDVAENEEKPTHWTHKLPEPPKEET